MNPTPENIELIEYSFVWNKKSIVVDDNQTWTHLCGAFNCYVSAVTYALVVNLVVEVEAKFPSQKFLTSLCKFLLEAFWLLPDRPT
jgi:hypothetical protein